MEVADSFNIPSARPLRFGNIAGRGGGTSRVKYMNLVEWWIYLSIEKQFLVEYGLHLFTRVETPK